MNAELIGILSVGAVLLVGLGGLVLTLDARQRADMDRLNARMDRLNARMDRMDARMDRMDAQMDRMDARMDAIDARLYEIAQTVVRMEATQQAMLDTLARLEARTPPGGELSPGEAPVPQPAASPSA